MKTVILVIAALTATAVLVLIVFALGFNRDVAWLEARLLQGAPGEVRTDLPEAVRAFAERGLAGGVPAAATRLEQAAEMRLRKGADWQAIPARQTIANTEPGFAWLAGQNIGPIPVVRVLDSYVDGAGLLDIRLLGAFRLDAYEGPEAALSEGLRYLAELPWAPDAIVLNRVITWAETEGGVTAGMETAGGPAEVLFSFNAAGDITGMFAADRPATREDGTIEPLDWRGTFSDYAVIGGRRIPTRGEVGYVYADGYEAYYRGQITAYEVVDAPTD